ACPLALPVVGSRDPYSAYRPAPRSSALQLPGIFGSIVAGIVRRRLSRAPWAAASAHSARRSPGLSPRDGAQVDTPKGGIGPRSWRGPVPSSRRWWLLVAWADRGFKGANCPSPLRARHLLGALPGVVPPARTGARCSTASRASTAPLPLHKNSGPL